MTDTRRLNVSDMDFESIKVNLKTFLKSQSTFQDYNFEGSAISSLIDMMAYVTHYNAVNANLGVNETFLDSAQFRGSVVGHARQLGYTPRSATAAVAYINITIANSGGSVMTIPKGTRFRSTINGQSYIFVTDEEYQTTGTVFSNVKIVQGEYKTVDYIFDTDTSEKFLINDVDVDTTTLEVNVYDSENATTFTTYTRAKLITSIQPDSRVYFIAENPDSKFEISFGDGILGAALEQGNVIRLTYVVCNKEEANDAAVFTYLDTIEGQNPTIETVNRALGGSDKETIEEIKRTAPLSYASQNRAVTAEDFKAILLENFQNIESIQVWGGEDNNPPSYGNVFISIKPKEGEALFSVDREFILNTIIKPKTMVSLTPILVDPIYTYIALEVFFKYNVSTTALTKTGLIAIIRSAISNYNDTYLSKFDGVLRHSTLSTAIDRSDKAILNSTVRVYMKKRFVPELSINQRIELQFSGDLYQADNGESIIYKSTPFTYAGKQCTLRDSVNSAGVRRVQIIYGEGSNIIVQKDDAGTIDFANRKIILSDFFIDNYVGEYIEITCIPNSNDIAPLRNNLLDIDMNDVVVDGNIDTIVAGQSPAGVNYVTTPRHA